MVLAVISLTGSATSAQKVHSDNQDIRFSAGVRIPIENTSATESEVMSLTYGRYFYNGMGFRTGVQWMFENYDINDYLGVPLYFLGAVANVHSKSQSSKVLTTPLGVLIMTKHITTQTRMCKALSEVFFWDCSTSSSSLPA